MRSWLQLSLQCWNGDHIFLGGNSLFTQIRGALNFYLNNTKLVWNTKSEFVSFWVLTSKFATRLAKLNRAADALLHDFAELPCWFCNGGTGTSWELRWNRMLSKLHCAWDSPRHIFSVGFQLWDDLLIYKGRLVGISPFIPLILIEFHSFLNWGTLWRNKDIPRTPTVCTLYLFEISILDSNSGCNICKRDSETTWCANLNHIWSWQNFPR